MHQTERTPRTYRHRGYVIEALPCGPHRWNIWRPRADLALCGVQSLSEAREVLAAIDRVLICAVFSLKCACSAPFRAFFPWPGAAAAGFYSLRSIALQRFFRFFQPAAAPPGEIAQIPCGYWVCPGSPAPRGRPQTPFSLRSPVLQRFSRFSAGRGH